MSENNEICTNEDCECHNHPELTEEQIKELQAENEALKKRFEQEEKEKAEAAIVQRKKLEKEYAEAVEARKKEFEEFLVEYKKVQEPYLKEYIDKDEPLEFWRVLSESFALAPEVDVEFNIPETTVTRNRFWCHLGNPEEISKVLEVLVSKNFLNETGKEAAKDFFKDIDEELYYQLSVGIDYDTEKRIRFAKAFPSKYIYETLVLCNNQIESTSTFVREAEPYKAYESQFEIFSKFKLDLHLASYVLAIKNGDSLTKVRFPVNGDPVKCPGTNHLTNLVELEKDKITFFVKNPNDKVFQPTPHPLLP